MAMRPIGACIARSCHPYNATESNMAIAAASPSSETVGYQDSLAVISPAILLWVGPIGTPSCYRDRRIQRSVIAVAVLVRRPRAATA